MKIKKRKISPYQVKGSKEAKEHMAKVVKGKEKYLFATAAHEEQFGL